VGPVMEIVQATVTSLIGVSFLAASIQGFALTRMGAAQRVALFAAAVLLIKPGWITDLIGLAIGIAIGFVHLSRYRSERALAQGGGVPVPGGR